MDWNPHWKPQHIAPDFWTPPTNPIPKPTAQPERLANPTVSVASAPPPRATGRKTCDVCHSPVYFLRAADGGYLYLDEIKWPWAKHRCRPSNYTPLTLPSSSLTLPDDLPRHDSLSSAGVITGVLPEQGRHWLPLRVARRAFSDFQAALRAVLSDADCLRPFQRLQSRVLGFLPLTNCSSLSTPVRAKLEWLNRAYGRMHALGLHGNLTPSNFDLLLGMGNPYPDEDEERLYSVHVAYLSVDSSFEERTPIPTTAQRPPMPEHAQVFLENPVLGWTAQDFVGEPCTVLDGTVRIAQTHYAFPTLDWLIPDQERVDGPRIHDPLAAHWL